MADKAIADFLFYYICPYHQKKNGVSQQETPSLLSFLSLSHALRAVYLKHTQYVRDYLLNSQRK